MSAICRAARIIAPLVAMFSLLVDPSWSALAATWNNATGGSWSTPGNWDALPNAVDAIANFNTLDLNADATVTLDGSFTVGSLLFGDVVPSNNWIINPGTPTSSTLTLNVSTGSPTIGVFNSTAIPIPSANSSAAIPFVNEAATINAVLAGSKGFVKTGPGTLVLTAKNTFTGPTSVNSGELTLDYSAANGPNGSGANTIISSASPLSLGAGTAAPASGGTLNLNGSPTATGAITQAFAGTTINFGTNLINVNQNGDANAVNLSLGAISRAPAGTLVGGVPTGGGAVAFVLPTTGNITTTTANDSTGVLGGWATVATAPLNGLASLSLSTDLAANDGSGNIVAYTGYTIPTGAAPTIASNTASNVKIDATSTGNPTVGAGTTDLHNIVFTDTVARTLTIASGNTLRLGTAGAIIKTQNNANALTVGATGSFLTAGGPNSGTPGELILNANATTPDVNGMVVASLITDNGAGGVVTLVKTGQAAVQMNAANTYSGGSYIESGRLRANAVGGFGTGPVNVANGASSYINAAGTYNNNFFISGKAFYEGGNSNGTGVFSSGAIRLATNGIVLAGTITLTGDALIGARGASGAGSTISGQITGPFAMEFNNTGTTNGIIILSNTTNNTNNWAGNTTVSSGVLRMGASEVIPNGSGKGNVIINGATDTTVTNNSVLDLNGMTETINGLSSAGTLTRDVVTSNIAGTGTLIVGDNNASGSYGGSIQNGTTAATMVFALTKIGTGVQTLSGTSTYSGNTSIQNGTLLVGADTALSSNSTIVLGSATANTSGVLDLAGFSPTVAGLSTAGTGTANIIGNSSNATMSTLTFAGGTTPTVFGGKIQDTLPGGNQKVALAITSGTLALGGSNTFTGGAMVNGGTLSVTGSLVAANTVTVNSGAMLTGNGNGSTTGLAGTVSGNGGTVYPGTTPGDIAKLATSSLSIHNGGLMIDLGPSLTSDQVKDLGALTIGDPGGAAPTLNIVGTTANGSYEIIDYSGALTKNVDFNISGTLGFGYTLNYATPGKVFLNVAAITKNLVWTGAADQTSWDTSHVNFNDGSNNVAYSDPNPVVFGDSSPASATTINLSGTVSPLAVSFVALSRNYTIQGSGTIAGSGGLFKNFGTTLTILNNNTYTGTTTISAGTIQVGNGSASGSLGSGAITNNGSLVYNRSDSVTVSNAISGSGTFRQAGTGTVILAGSNSYTDATVISSGTLQVGDGTTNGNLGAGNVANSGTLVFDRSDAVVVANNIALTGAASTLVQNSTAGTGSTTINGNISGIGSVQVNSGTLTLGGTNTYGNTTISSGATLQIGAGGTSGTLGTGTLTNQGTLVFNRSDALAVNGAIGDIGNVQQAGSGTTTFNAANTYSGMTIISGGTLAVGAGGTLGNGTNDLIFGNGTAGTGGLDLSNKSVTVNNLTANSNSPNTSTITIGAGKTLTVAGNVLVGGFTAPTTADNPISNLAVTGGGTLVLGAAGGNLIIDNLKNNNTGSGDTINAKLDLSGLSTFTANYLGGNIGVGAGANGVGGNAPFGQLILANTNTLTAATFDVGINNGGGNTSKSSVSLGTTNVINVDAINVGAGKTQTSPTVTGSINFRAGLTNPTVTLRGSDGVSRVSSMVVGAGNLNNNGSTTGMGGTVDLTAGTVDAMIDNLKVGVGAHSSTGTSLGNLLFNAGTINANELTIGQQGDSIGSPANGTVTIGGGNLVVNGGSDGFAILLGNKPNAAGAGPITGNLNINGGSVSVAGDVFGGTGVSNLTLNGGTLDIQGHNLGVATGSSNPVNGNPTGPITTLNFQAGTLKNVAEINGGGVGLTKTVTGALTISGDNTYSGPTTVTQGTLTLGNNNAIKAGAATPVSNLVLNGGTFATGGFSDTLGSLTLAANSSLDLGAGTSVLHFASSNDTLDGITWSGSTLTVNNWSGTPGTGGGTDEIFVGSSATGLSTAQLAKIQFTGFTGIKLLGTGEVVPLTASAQFLLGDINQDNHVNATDITAMLTALTDLNAYRALHPTLSDANVISIADINGDGKWNNADIQTLLGYLQAGHGSAAAVPEPATWLIVASGLIPGVLTLQRRRRRVAS